MAIKIYGKVRIGGVTTSVVDSDAQAFITAAGITDATQQSAINTLVTSLKSNNLWTKMKAIYPFVGGTASSHKWNLKDPRDLDAAFRLTFNGGWTHNSTGALPNGTTGYANTYFTPSVDGWSINNGSVGLYCSGSSQDGKAIGFYGVSGAVGASYIIPSALDGTGGYRLNFTAQIGTVQNSPNGFFAMSLNGSNNLIILNKTSSDISTTIVTPTGICDRTITLAALNYTSIQDFSSLKHITDYISSGLSSSELSILYTLIVNFNTTLGRAV